MEEAQQQTRTGEVTANEEARRCHASLRSERPGQRHVTGNEEEKTQDQEILRKESRGCGGLKCRDMRKKIEDKPSSS